MTQFQSATHSLTLEDKELNKKYELNNNATHTLLLELPEGSQWSDRSKITDLQNLVGSLEEVEGVEKIVSLSNVQTAIIDRGSFYVGSLNEISEKSENLNWIYKDRLISPNLVSADGRYTLIFVQPVDALSQVQHEGLMRKIKNLSTKSLPYASAQVGGTAAIRTEVLSMLNSELSIFVGLSVLAALLILLLVFQGFSAVPLLFSILVSVNILSLGFMAYLGLHFTMLSTTVPILVSITAVAITTHTFVRLSKEKLHELHFPARTTQIYSLLKELTVPHILTASTTAVGFGTLIFSDVPLIKEYGISVASGVLISAAITLLILSSGLCWIKTPKTRHWIGEFDSFSNALMKHKVPALGSIMAVLCVMSLSSFDLQWTARLFDDIPKQNESRVSTEFIGKHLGGVIPLNISIGSDDQKNSPWKNSQNVKKLDKLFQQWRTYPGVGSVYGITDFIKAGHENRKIPQVNNMISETFFVYGMGSENPLKSFLTPSENHTRVEIRLQDLPSNESQVLVQNLKNDVTKAFPEMEIHFGGIGYTTHQLNKTLSNSLMYGFFHSLIWIVLLLSIMFKSIRWSLVAVIPNLVPPIVLLGALSWLNVPIKPGIAIIFAISLGMAFDNTVYILGRLKELLKSHNNILPIGKVLTLESGPCLVSSMSLLMGFSIFVLSDFSINQSFGAFMILSIVSSLAGDLVLLPILLKLFPGLLISNPASENLVKEKITQGKSMIPTTMSLILATMMTLVTPSNTFAKKGTAKLNADQILKNVKSKTSPPNESTHMMMKINESDGSTKDRDIMIYRKNGKQQKALVRILDPSDLKGVALLTISEGQSEDQWLYLPASKRSRRIVGSGKSGKFLDSDLSYEDMRIDTYKQFTNKLVKTIGKNNEIALIESLAKKSSDSSYKKIHTWVHLKHSRIEKVKYFDKKGNALKTMTFKSYKKLRGKYWRAKFVKIENIQDKRKTTLKLKSVSLKKLGDEKFSISALEQG